MQVNVGDVFHLYCQTCVTPKWKFFVVALVEPFLCFVINSKPTRFQQRRPDLLRCLAPISVTDEAYLTHDSFIACNELFSEHTLEELMAKVRDANDRSRRLGALSQSSRDQVARALVGNRFLKRKYLRLLEKEWP